MAIDFGFPYNGLLVGLISLTFINMIVFIFGEYTFYKTIKYYNTKYFAFVQSILTVIIYSIVVFRSNFH